MQRSYEATSARVRDPKIPLAEAITCCKGWGRPMNDGIMILSARTESF